MDEAGAAGCWPAAREAVGCGRLAVGVGDGCWLWLVVGGWYGGWWWGVGSGEGEVGVGGRRWAGAMLIDGRPPVKKWREIGIASRRSVAGGMCPRSPTQHPTPNAPGVLPPLAGP
jgi:hypothetical protein